MEDNKIEKWTLEDGRKAEKVIVEKKLENEEVERVIEIKFESERPLSVQQRIVERYKPFVYERRIETIDPNTGEVLEVKVENLGEGMSAQYAGETLDSDYVTKKEMVEAIIKAVKSSKENTSNTSSKEFKIKSMGLAQEISEVNSPKYDVKNIALSTLVLLQVIGLIYLLFFN
jgi:20S proteasome alpha/beta subunit